MRWGLSLVVLLSGCGLFFDLDPTPDASGVDGGSFDGGGFDAGIGERDTGLPVVDADVVDAERPDAGGCAPETCNGLDDDCDGFIDECELPNAVGECSAATGECGIVTCVEPYADCNGLAADGCEADLDFGIGGCGACGAICIDSPCVFGVCNDPYIEVSAGTSHTCAHTYLGQLFCWGHNDEGEVGIGSGTSTVDRPARVAGVTGVYAMEASGHFTCAAEPRGVFCWGLGESGRLGYGSASGLRAPASSPTFPGAVHSLGSGFDSTIVSQGAALGVRGWGDNQDGQLGTGSSVPSLAFSPTTSSVISGAAQVTMGYHFACAVIGSAVQCWGTNIAGQLGRGDAARGLVSTPTPAPVSGMDPTSPAVQVSAGQAHACARTAAGDVYCWGSNSAYQSDDSRTDTSTPVFGASAVALPGPATDVAAGGNTSCAVVGGVVYCWGANASGQTGVGVMSSVIRFAQIVPGLTGVLSVDCGTAHTCAVTGADAIYCWGDSSSGRLGTGSSTGPRFTPQMVSSRGG